jgi:hypothetical protein
VSYRQRSTALALEVSCESWRRDPPPAAAFADPDDASKSCARGAEAGDE